MSCAQTTKDKAKEEHVEKNHTKNYVITGHVANIPASKVYLNTMKFNSEDRAYWPTIDSAEYVNGKFVLNRDTILVEPAWASNLFYIDSLTGKNVNLAFDNKYFSTKDKPSRNGSFILENAIIKIDGDINDKNGLLFEGSKETDFDFKYSLMRPTYTKLEAIDKKIDSAKHAPDTSTVASFRMEKEELNKKFASQNAITIISLLNFTEGFLLEKILRMSTFLG